MGRVCRLIDDYDLVMMRFMRCGFRNRRYLGRVFNGAFVFHQDLSLATSLNLVSWTLVRLVKCSAPANPQERAISNMEALIGVRNHRRFESRDDFQTYWDNLIKRLVKLNSTVSAKKT